MKMFMFALPSILLLIVEVTVIIYCIRVLYLLQKNQKEYMEKIDQLIELLEKYEN